ncbi:putative adenylyl cyclase CyaB [Dictyocaulus viviparus]|uniref:Putative adenylyl cyclase CyaB n=1 Tax=Dictyocaulus viviparus TaxID=29172 RepID=A0A0D8X6J0_DICVI|nr:putative adenylyl cyclase CyaB [Dictyocaulus viviparus]
MLQLQYFDSAYDSDKTMRQSIVLKARVSDVEQAENLIFDLTESLGTFFVQEDVYFNVPKGNLKLRIMHPNRCGQLIFNALSKSSDHKLSESQVTEVEDVFSIRATLGAALGERGTITKKRRVFTMDDTRIYLDDVDQIGQFIDITVDLHSMERSEGYAKVKEIRDRLRINDDEIVPAAYLDILMANISFDDDIPSRKSTKSSSETESDASI